jgi:hypothetical protein
MDRPIAPERRGRCPDNLARSTVARDWRYMPGTGETPTAGANGELFAGSASSVRVWTDASRGGVAPVAEYAFKYYHNNNKTRRHRHPLCLARGEINEP